MCDSEAEKILFILNKHEREYRLLIPVYIFLAIVLWILPILLMRNRSFLSVFCPEKE